MSEGTRSVAETLQRYVDQELVAGIVAVVADGNEVLSCDTPGYADRADGRPMAPDTMFWIASQSKPITATAAAILVDEGRLDYDDPVARWIPEFDDQVVSEDGAAPRPPARAVTIRDLLSHLSGLPFSSAAEEPTLDGLALVDAVASYAAAPLTHDPGSRFEYSNAGFNTVGRIIELASGLAFEEFLRQRLFDPLGMRDTTFVPNAAQRHRLATSYRPGPDGGRLVETPVSQLRYPLDGPGRYPMPAGGLFSSPSDLVAFYRMVLRKGQHGTNRILSEAAVETMTRRQTPATSDASYGLGWSVGDGTVGHGGAYSTLSTIHLVPGLVTIFLVQQDGFGPGGDSCASEFEKAALADAVTGRRQATP